MCVPPPQGQSCHVNPLRNSPPDASEETRAEADSGWVVIPIAALRLLWNDVLKRRPWAAHFLLGRHDDHVRR